MTDPEHGTPRGASWHRRRGERMCKPCQGAENRRKSTYTAARNAAIEVLISRHPEEYLEIYGKEKEARMAERTAEVPDTAERNRLRTAAYNAALRRLAAEHHAVFVRYYQQEKQKRGL